MKKKIFSLIAILLVAGTVCLAASGTAGSSPSVKTPNDVKKEEVLDVDYGETVSFHEGDIKATDQGAKGDGSTDDTAAINAAMAAAKANGKTGVVFFPKGTYRITGKLDSVTSDLTFAFEKGAVLHVDNGGSVYYRGYLKAGFYQVVKVTGTGKLTGILTNSYTLPQWFGAKGDGNTDDSAAFNQALTVCKELAIPYTAKGYVVSEVTVRSNSRVYGCDSKKPTLIGGGSGKNMFVFGNGATKIKVHNLSLDMTKSGKSTCFYFDGQTLGVNYVELRGIDTMGAYHVVRDARKPKSTGVYNINIILDNFNCKNTRERAIYVGNFWGFIFFRNMKFDNSEISSLGVTGNYPAIDFSQNEGAVIQNITVIGSDNAANTSEYGMYYGGNIATWVDGFTVKNTGGDGIRVEAGTELYFSNLNLDKMHGSGISFTDTTIIQVDHSTVTGRGGSGIGKAGISLSGTQLANISYCTVSKMQGDGLLLNGNTRMTVTTDLTCTNNNGTGYNEASGKRNSCTNATLSGNGTQYNQTGEDSIGGNLKISGSTVASLAGAAKK